jgi:uncharacterized protein involved in outer membrane biogenesis
MQRTFVINSVLHSSLRPDAMIDKLAISAALRSPKTKKYGLHAIVAFVVIGILGFFVLPPIVKSLLIEKLGEALHRPVFISNVSINPFALSLQVDGVAIQEKGGGETVVSFDSLYVNLESSSLFRGGPVISEIRLSGPKFKIVRLADRRYNFSDLIDEMLVRPVSPTPTPTPPFSLNNIQLSGGSVEFDDRLADEKHVLGDINLTLPFISSLAYATESFVEPAFSAKLNGAPLAMKGKSKPFAESLESELILDLDNLQLAKYLDYAPFHLPITMVSGSLDGDLKVVFRQQKNRASTLSLSGTAALKDLLVKESSGAPLVSLKRLDLQLGSLDLLNQKIVIDRITIDSPVIHARIGRQGTINWLDLLPKTQMPDQSAAQTVGKPVTPGPAPDWFVAEAKVSGGVLNWLDESANKSIRASIEGFELDLKKLDSNASQPAEFDVAWRVNAGEWLKVEAVAVKDGRFNLVKRELLLGDVSVRGTRMLITRAADGSIDWLKPPTLRAVQSARKDAAKEEKTPWKLVVAKYRGEDMGVRFEDKAVSPMAVNVVDGLDVEIDNLSLEPGQPIKLASRFKLNGKGTVEIGGNVKLIPLDADLKLDVKTVELLPLQPYFTEKLNIAVTRGQVTLDGGLQLRQGATTADGLAGGFAGRATIGDFNAVDKINSADFLRWKSLYFGNVDLRLNPNSVSIDEVALADFFARIIVSPEGKLNLLQIVRKDDQAAPVSIAPAQPAEPTADVAVESADGKAVVPLVVAAKPPLPVKIGKVTLQGGSVNFSDNFVKPNYSARLKQIGGRITGLSSAADSIASLELRGNYDNVAPLNVTAKLNPLAAKSYLDLQAEIKGIEMTSLSTYAAKYAGYNIEKGKLSLFVKYKIENNQLEAENRIFIDQLTFGEAVESPGASRLPVSLAVSLLKNRNGEIDINLPISGSLDDPQFSIGGLVARVIGNLFVNALTSPFRLLASLFGGGSGGEELSFIEFEYGRASLSPASQKRLENLAKALIDRPALKLEIDGRVDLERDREGLKHARIERKVKSLKREELLKKGVEVASLNDVEISPQEYPVLLERVYRDEKFPKPRNLIGMVKSIPVEEMEKLMLTNSIVTEDDLLALGDRRAKAARDWLITHEVSTERMFLLPSKLGEAEGKSDAGEKRTASRVEFSLK